MQSFKDRNGREWGVDITVGAVRRVRDKVKFDIYGLIDDNFAKLNQVLSDPILLVDIVYVLCQDQAEKAGLLDTQFGESISGESLQAMAEAFVGAFIDFFPDRSKADVLRLTMARAKEASAMIDRENTKALTGMDVASVVANLKKKSGSAPESSV